MDRFRRIARSRKNLDSIQIAKPCSARWEEMEGDEKVRFCAHCKLNVFNLSAMELDEAANLIAEKDGRLCVRFYRRRDGTILTQDCPKGLAAARKRIVVACSAAASMAMSFFTGMFGLNRAFFHPAIEAPKEAHVSPGRMAGQFMGGMGMGGAPLMGRPASPIRPIMGAPIQGYVGPADRPASLPRMHDLGDAAPWKPEGAKRAK